VKFRSHQKFERRLTLGPLDGPLCYTCIIHCTFSICMYILDGPRYTYEVNCYETITKQPSHHFREGTSSSLSVSVSRPKKSCHDLCDPSAYGVETLKACRGTAVAGSSDHRRVVEASSQPKPSFVPRQDIMSTLFESFDYLLASSLDYGSAVMTLI
jgi:hypothetical protein